MKSRAPSVLFSSTLRFRPVLESLRARGVEVDKVLAALGTSERQLLDPGTRVPREITVRLSQELVRALQGDPTAGLAAAHYFKLPDLGLLGYIVRHSEHVLGALTRFVRYQRLIADAAQCAVQQQRGRVVFRAGLLGGRALSASGVDYSLASILIGLREVAVAPVPLLAAKLARPAPRDPRPYRRVFGANVQFAAEHSELVFEQRSALQPLTTHDPQLLAILEQHAQAVLSALPTGDSFVAQVRDFISARLEQGAYSAASTARSFGMSERTLRRRLDAASSSYRVLLDAVRRERAVTLIADERLSITQVAQQVGFDDPSTFASAFRRWTGRSPRAAKSGKTPALPRNRISA